MQKQRVLILGAGFGGMFTARHLARHSDLFDVEIIDEENYFVFQPLLPEVVAGTIEASDAVAPLRRLLPNSIKVREAQVVGIDLERREIEVVQGMGRKLRKIGYDQLVIAMGSRVDLSRFPGLADHAFTMKDLSDAFALRNHLVDCLEQADITEEPELKRRLLTFAVIGGGLSGVEVLGEMEHMLSSALRFYPHIRREELRFALIEYAPTILAEMPENLSAYALRRLQKRGVEIYTGQGVKSASSDTVELSDGRLIHGMTIIATIGNSPPPLLAELPIAKQRGRIATDHCLRVPGQDGVWALGDAAAVPAEPPPADSRPHRRADDPKVEVPPPTAAPPTAQAARQQAKVLAANLVAQARGEPMTPFHYRSKGQLASLGGQRGIANILGVNISGFPAFFLWRLLYLGMLPGAATKTRVAVDWLLGLFLRRNLVKVVQRMEPAIFQSHYREGDVVFREGDACGPFFIVMAGRFERKSRGADTIEIIERGGVFGESALKGEKTRQSTVTALENGCCLVIKRDDFALLSKGWQVLAPRMEAEWRRTAEAEELTQRESVPAQQNRR
ncbi:FAD-dependent oxidoreductase [Telmatospirillum sp. J64-1]|uniref:FAD-dependent oxidoreductase n=1 Tax=Telmatospirillum sp. J64-1 TaxID=2502183 RepID=UPI00115D279E|nr:FAD-dependent oxidoreductase [Telmatospirillum sp. J64-1]